MARLDDQRTRPEVGSKRRGEAFALRRWDLPGVGDERDDRSPGHVVPFGRRGAVRSVAVCETCRRPAARL